MILSIVVFFILAIGLGFLVDLFIKNWSAGFLEKLIIRIGAGVLLIPVFGVLFNHLHIPIHWMVFFILAIIVFCSAIYFRKEILLEDCKSLKKALSSFRIKKSQIYALLIFVLFAISAYMYIQGSFNYPWFENGDPYPYALASKYISLEKTYSAPYYFTHFAEPYPQGYPIFMGLMHQTNDSIYWTLKFFNALIASFSILFFFYFARKFTKRNSIAFWSTFTLAAIPAWLGHFVFALNFNMALMFLLFYALFSVEENKNWKYLGAIFYGAIIINHFYTSVVITALLLIVYLLRVLAYKDFSKDYLDVFAGGLVLGLVFWVPALAKHWNVLEGGEQLGGLYVFLPLFQKIGSSFAFAALFLGIIAVIALLYWKNQAWFGHVRQFLTKKDAALWIYSAVIAIVLLVLIIPSDKIIYAKGSGTRVYGLVDFFIAQKGNMINNPIGIGFIVMLLFIAGLIIIALNFRKLFKKDNFYLLVALTWVIFSFLGVMGASLSIGFVPFRMWTFFGMALSLVTGYSIYLIFWALNGKQRIAAKSIFVLLLVILVYFTSFSPKYWHNTSPWPEHQIMVPESQQLYVWIREGGLPKDSMVTNICHREFLLLGYDMLSKPWLSEELYEKNANAYYTTALNKSLADNYEFLKRNNFDYVTIGASCIAKFKADAGLVNQRVQEMIDSSDFQIVKNTKTEFLFRVV